MRILVIGDCHGRKPEIPDTEYDMVLAVGDICGGTDEMRTHMFQAIDSENRWYELMGEEKAKREVEKSIEDGREILEQLNNLQVPVFIVPGNWDWSREQSDWKFLEEKGYEQMVSEYENIHDLNFSREELGDFSFVGYGPCSGPELPQYEDDKPETDEELEEMREEYREKKEELQRLFERTGSRTIFLSHNAPNNTDLDMIENEDSPKHGRHYGSVIVRELVEEYGPEFNVAGHMHEGKGTDEIGETLCINTGLQNSLVIDTAREGREFV